MSQWKAGSLSLEVWNGLKSFAMPCHALMHCVGEQSGDQWEPGGRSTCSTDMESQVEWQEMAKHGKKWQEPTGFTSKQKIACSACRFFTELWRHDLLHHWVQQNHDGLPQKVRCKGTKFMSVLMIKPAKWWQSMSSRDKTRWLLIGSLMFLLNPDSDWPEERNIHCIPLLSRALLSYRQAGYPQEALNEIHGSWFDPSNPVAA